MTDHRRPTAEEHEKMRGCVGCVQNFYNGNNPYGVEVCWSLAAAETIKLYRIGMDTPMDKRSNFQEITGYKCRREAGYALLKQLPSHLKDSAK